MNSNLKPSETVGENSDSREVLQKAQVVMDSVVTLELLIQAKACKAAAFAGILANLKKYEPTRFPTIWSNSKEELFSTQKEILELIANYRDALSKSTGGNLGKGYSEALLYGYVSSEIRQESDFDSDRPANLAKFARLVLSWERSPKGDMSPSAILARSIATRISEACGEAG